MSKAKNILIAAVAMASLTGCSNWFGGGRSEEDLDADRRFTPAARPAVEPVHSGPEGTDQPGHIAPSNAPRDVQDKVSPAAPESSVTPPSPTPSPTPSPRVSSPPSSPSAPPVPPPSLPPALPVASAPDAARPTTMTSGTYMTLGGVVAEVNEHPIYANQVLREIVGPLAARARDLDEVQFRRAALDLIQKQIEVLATTEREVAAAQRNLDEEEKTQARMLAARWRQRQITESGGSLEVAKRKWAAEGYDFEDRVEQEYRKILSQLYYQRKVWPRVQVSADEMRRYYRQHLNTAFTEHDQVRFRVIKVDPRRSGGREQALEKIKGLHQRATRGEDFGAMASSVNDDAFLMKRGGDVGWVQKGAYANEQVEKAVWPLQPGGVTDIVDAGGAFYIAKLEERKLGRVMPFDEQAVQDRITKELRTEQFRQLRERVLKALSENSVVRTDPDMVNTAIDMAMQNYPRWRAEGRGEAATPVQPQSTGQ